MMKIAKTAAVSLLSTTLLFGASAILVSPQISASSSEVTAQAQSGSKSVTVELLYDAGSYYSYSDAEGYSGRLPFVRKVGQVYIYSGTVFFQ